MTPLPIDACLPEIIDHLRRSRCLVLVAEPGAGKTTRVPPAILRAGLLDSAHPNLVMLQPRRVAARAAAERIADENGWTLGDQVGYHVRFDHRLGPATRLRVLTEGILTRRLQEDPFLEGIGAVVLDEFHERSLHTDIAAALLREVRQTVREDLILVVMSATLEAEPVAKFLGNCPIVRAAGRTYDVKISYAGPKLGAARRPLSELTAEAVAAEIARGAAATHGDLLVFLPGAEEIRRTIRRLEPVAEQHDLLLLPLHGSLRPEDQLLALRPASRRKVILATNIAETSLTIEGVRTVIDTGLARVASYDPRRGLDGLELQKISQASATQRAGRAGRTAPGRCVRLWTERENASRPAFETPEVRRVDLCGAVLALHAWGTSHPRTFGWFEAPPEEALESAERLLAMLGGLDAGSGGRITALGRRLLSVPAHPRLARLLIAAAERGLLAEGAAVAALLSEKDLLRSDRSEAFHLRTPSTQGPSDLLIRLEALRRAGQQRFSQALLSEGIDPGAARQAAKARDELMRIGRRLALPAAHPSVDEESLLQLPLLAFPDRVAKRRPSDPAAGVLTGGGSVRLAPESVVRQGELFLALDARHDERGPAREALVRVASLVKREWLEAMFPAMIRHERGAEFDPQRERVVGFVRVWYRDLLLQEERDAPVDPQEASRVLAEAIRPRAAALFAADEAAAGWLARLALLKQAMPEHSWPPADDEQLAELLVSALAGKRSVEEVRRTPLVPLLQTLLRYPLDRVFEEQAPETIEVPSGSRIRIAYAAVQKPVLAVRLQELFGWTGTPRIAAGRVPLVLHLLGPNYRPVQITEDLGSFWSDAYFQVRKDLRTRYPKHSWPQEPLTARPEAKGRRKS